MANFITTAITWGGKETTKYFIKPLFSTDNPFLGSYIQLYEGIKTDEKINYFGAVSKVLKAYAKGFTGSNYASHTQRTWSVAQLKAEGSQDANAFKDTVFQIVQRSGVDWNNIEGTELETIIMNVFMEGVQADVARNIWLNDTGKKTATGSTTSRYYTTTADTDYNEFTGIWDLIMDNAATSPSATQIKRVAMSNGLVVQVVSADLASMTAGTMTLTINGVAYSQAFSSNNNTTVTAWATAHTAALAARGITVADGGSGNLTLTGSEATAPFVVVVGTSGGTGGTWTIANDTAPVAPAALAADEARDTFSSMIGTSMPAILRKANKQDLVLFVSDSMYDNLRETYQTEGTDVGNTLQINGIPTLLYNGIPVVNVGWDYHLDNDFVNMYPHRAILTTKQNLVVGFDNLDEFTKQEFWYNKDEQENRFRIQLKMGANYVHNELMVVAY